MDKVTKRHKRTIRIMKEKIQKYLSRFSFRTGMIVLILYIPCYIISFAQTALPISNTMKGVLWFIFFGLAKTFQYGGLSIIGVEGVKRIKNYWKERKKQIIKHNPIWKSKTKNHAQTVSFAPSTTKIQNLYWDVSGVGTSISAQAGKDT